MGEKKVCGTCKAYKRPRSDGGAEHNAGGCGDRRLRYVGAGNERPVLDDELIVRGRSYVQMSFGPNFGCVHWR